MIIPVCLASNRNYLKPLTSTMASILFNKLESDEIRFYILENDFHKEDYALIEQLKSIAPFEVRYLNVKDKVLQFVNITEKDHISIESYFRLFIPELIPEEDKIIYLDCDIIVQNSLSELYNIPLITNGIKHYVAGVRDLDARRNILRLKTKRYINAGVLLIDSLSMREDKIFHRLVDVLRNETHRLEMHDQDVVAIVLGDTMKYIPDKWNGQIARLPVKEAVSRLHQANILHYVGHKKPWLPNKRAKFIDNYFKYQRLTPFANTESQYHLKRFFWHLSKLPSNLLKLIYSKTNSKQGTFRYISILGFLKFKKKRKSPLLDLKEKW